MPPGLIGRGWMSSTSVSAGHYAGTYRVSATSQNGAPDSALYGPGEGTPERVQVAVPAEPRHFRVTSRNGAMALSWLPPEDRGVTVTGYRVFRIDGNDVETTVATLPGSATTYSDTPPAGTRRARYRHRRGRRLTAKAPARSARAPTAPTTPALEPWAPCW